MKDDVVDIGPEGLSDPRAQRFERIVGLRLVRGDGDGDGAAAQQAVGGGRWGGPVVRDVAAVKRTMAVGGPVMTNPMQTDHLLADPVVARDARQAEAATRRAASAVKDSKADAELRTAEAVRAVHLENLSASGLAAEDARVVFAIDVERSLEGGRAAALRPERRERLVAGAVKRGMRPFDANLVIAIVQDAARRGETLNATQHGTVLRMVKQPERAEGRFEWLLVAAVVLGLVMAVAMATIVVNGVP